MNPQDAQAAPATPTAQTTDLAIFPAELKGAIQFRNKNQRIKRWKDYTRIVAHNYSGDTNTDQPVVNIIAARCRQIAPMLAFNNPTFNVQSVGKLPNANSEVAIAAALQKSWRDEQVGEVFQDVLLDWPTIGRGIIFVGFEAAQEGGILDAKRSIAESQAAIERQSVGRKVIDNVRKLLGRDTNNPVDPPSEVQNYKLLLGQRVFAERVSNFDFVLDPCASSPRNATFMGRKLHLPLTRAQIMFGKDCPKADSIGNVAIYADESDADPWGQDNAIKDADKFPETIRRVDVWEVWDIVLRKTVYVDMKGHVIGQPYDWKSAHPGFPFVLLDWDPVADCVYPEGLAAAIHTLNNEINEVRRRELGNLGMAWGITIGPDTMDPKHIKAITEAKDNAYVGLPPELVDQVKPLQRQPLPADVWGVENRIMANMDELAHFSAAGSGGMNPVRRTATEVSLSSSGQDATMSFRQLQVEAAAEQVAERMMAAIFTTFDQPMTVRIVNQDAMGVVDEAGQPVPVGEPIDYPFVGTEHAGFYKATVASGSMASVAQDVERQQAQTIMQLYGNEPWFDRKAFALHHLSMFPSIKDPSKYIKVAVPDQAASQTTDASGNVVPFPPQGGEQGGEPQPSADMGIGSGTGLQQADLMAGVQGQAAPMTGTNGYPGPTQ